MLNKREHDKNLKGEGVVHVTFLFPPLSQRRGGEQLIGPDLARCVLELKKSLKDGISGYTCKRDTKEKPGKISRQERT